MARGPSARVVLNRRAMTEVELSIADGIVDLGQAIVEAANPPDAAPYGEGLVTRGGVLVYYGPGKVGGWGEDGRQPKKPRAFRVAGARGITAAIGFGFPGRFQEFGTVHHGAQPFFVRAFNAVGRLSSQVMRPTVSARLRRLAGR
jgi:hypothetical protein